MCSRGRLSAVLVLLLSTIAAAFYAHPFIPTATGTVWEYAYNSSSLSLYTGTANQTSRRFSGRVSITILDSTGRVRVAVKGTDSGSVQSIFLVTTNTVHVYDTSFAALSIAGIVLDSFCGMANPFCIDSLFIGDSTGKKSTSVSGSFASSTLRMSFDKVAFQKDTLFMQSIVNSYFIAVGDLQSSSGDTTKFLQKYGLIYEGSTSSSCCPGAYSTSKSFALTSFNGTPFNESGITVVNPVPMIEMEPLYPAYAVHISNITVDAFSQHSFSSPLFTARCKSRRIELFVHSSHAYSLSVTDILGRTTRFVRGNAPVVPLEFNTPGVYIFTLRSGERNQTARIGVW